MKGKIFRKRAKLREDVSPEPPRSGKRRKLKVRFEDKTGPMHAAANAINAKISHRDIKIIGKQERGRQTRTNKQPPKAPPYVSPCISAVLIRLDKLHIAVLTVVSFCVFKVDKELTTDVTRRLCGFLKRF
jgi:hypothetical protein